MADELDGAAKEKGAVGEEEEEGFIVKTDMKKEGEAAKSCLKGEMFSLKL